MLPKIRLDLLTINRSFVWILLPFAVFILSSPTSISQTSKAEASNPGGRSQASNTAADPPSDSPTITLMFERDSSNGGKIQYALPCYHFSYESNDPAKWKFYKKETVMQSGTNGQSRDTWGPMSNVEGTFSSNSHGEETIDFTYSLSYEGNKAGEAGRVTQTSKKIASEYFSSWSREKYTGNEATSEYRAESDSTDSRPGALLGTRTWSSYSYYNGEPSEGNGTFTEPASLSHGGISIYNPVVILDTPTQFKKTGSYTSFNDYSSGESHDIQRLFGSATEDRRMSNEFTTSELITKVKGKKGIHGKLFFRRREYTRISYIESTGN